MKKKTISGFLFDITRTIGKVASAAYDVETISTGDPTKIAKRFIKKGIRKKVYGETNKALRKF